MMTENAKHYLLYTLHFSKLVSGKLHYTGIAHRDRIEHRLQAHARGQGANLTKRAVMAGARLVLVDLIEAGGFEDERALKNNRHANRRCSLCSPSIAPTKMQPREIISTLLPVPTPSPLLLWKGPSRGG